MSKFKVGDTVIVKGSYNESRYGEKFWEDAIAKVGRKYVYLHGDGRTAYEADTGHQKPTRYSGSERHIYLPEEWEAKNRRHPLRLCWGCRRQVVAAIRSHGLRPDGYAGFTQTTEVLEQILAALEADA